MNALTALRSAWRALLRRPLHAALVVATLAVGIGGATAVFALVHGVLLDPLPYEESDRLVTLDVTSASSGFGISLSIPHYEDWRDRSRGFSHFGAAAGWNLVRSSPEGAERLAGQLVLGDFFQLLGLRVAEGRALTASDTEAGAAPLAILGHALRVRAFPPDRPVVGQSITLDGVPHEVAGILAPGEGYPSADVDVYLPMGARSASLPWEDRGSSFGTRALARLSPGVTVAAAQEDMDRVVREVTAEVPEDAVTAGVRTVRDMMLGDVSRGLWILMGAVVLVLLIAGANVANLALARSEGRADELRVRRALGAGRRDVVGLVLSESVWLSALGGGAGTLLAFALVGALPAVLPMEIPAVVAGRVAVNGGVLAFALAVTVGAGVLFALIPALRTALAGVAPSSTRSDTGDRATRRLRETLVTGQVAISVILLVAAGLLVRSLGALTDVEKGFDEEGVLTARLIAPDGTFEAREEWLAFHDEVLEAMEGSPDVGAAATTLLMPLTGSSWELRARSEAGPEVPDERPSVLYNVVSERYFETLEVPMVRGRAFELADTEGAPLVAIVDESMVDRFWPGEDGLGQRISVRDTPDGPEWRTVVGVATNTRHYTLAEPSRPQVYVPMRQAGSTTGVSLRLAAKVSGDPAAAVTLLRETVRSLRPGVPVVTPRMLDEYVADATGANRAMGVVTAGFAILAVLLASLGVFGILTLMVTRRAREIGVRMAVGASPRDVLALVVGQGLRVVAAGAVLGLVVSAAGARSLEAFLYQVQPLSAGVYLGALALLLAVSVCAATPPAIKAAAMAPGRILKDG